MRNIRQVFYALAAVATFTIALASQSDPVVAQAIRGEGECDVSCWSYDDPEICIVGWEGCVRYPMCTQPCCPSC